MHVCYVCTWVCNKHDMKQRGQEELDVRRTKASRTPLRNRIKPEICTYTHTHMHTHTPPLVPQTSHTLHFMLVPQTSSDLFLQIPLLRLYPHPSHTICSTYMHLCKRSMIFCRAIMAVLRGLKSFLCRIISRDQTPASAGPKDIAKSGGPRV